MVAETGVLANDGYMSRNMRIAAVKSTRIIVVTTDWETKIQGLRGKGLCSRDDGKLQSVFRAIEQKIPVVIVSLPEISVAK
uniref:Uncharacterized protein n=1 Tax=Archaeoglobus fulgidus TaxID=2234 RepID=A0A7C2SNY0_ARCFL